MDIDPCSRWNGAVFDICARGDVLKLNGTISTTTSTITVRTTIGDPFAYIYICIYMLEAQVLNLKVKTRPLLYIAAGLNLRWSSSLNSDFDFITISLILFLY